MPGGMPGDSGDGCSGNRDSMLRSDRSGRLHHHLRSSLRSGIGKYISGPSVSLNAWLLVTEPPLDACQTLTLVADIHLILGKTCLRLSPCAHASHFFVFFLALGDWTPQAPKRGEAVRMEMVRAKVGGAVHQTEHIRHNTGSLTGPGGVWPPHSWKTWYS